MASIARHRIGKPGRRWTIRHLRARPLRAGSIATILVVSVALGTAPAWAGWHRSATVTASIAYNQGIAFDPLRREFFLDGVTSRANSGLYRTDSRLTVTAANVAVIPATREGYNHAGDLSFDSRRRRVLLPLECYYPGAGGNTCRRGAIGVADPVTLRLRYYINLDRAQINKAMWAEISPDGRWIWTSSQRHLVVYPAAAVNPNTAHRQRTGASRGIAGRDLGAVLPAGGVTGAAFYQDAFSPAPRLLLALNRGSYSEVVSYQTGSKPDGRPRLASKTPHSEIRVPRSASNSESEGLAVTGAGHLANPLGGVLHWLMLPAITTTPLQSRILSYLPTPPTARKGVSLAELSRSHRASTTAATQVLG
jgi:hypothetical protein